MIAGILLIAAAAVAHEHGDLPSLPSLSSGDNGVECLASTTIKHYNPGAPVSTEGDGQPKDPMTFEFLSGDKFKVFLAGQELSGPMVTTPTTYTIGAPTDWTSADGKDHHVSSGIIINRATGELFASDDWTWRYPSGLSSSNSVTTGKCRAVHVAAKM